MKVYKKNLPEGVKKCFAYEKGVKVKLINKLYLDEKKRNKKLENAKKAN
mgnify:FL=1